MMNKKAENEYEQMSVIEALGLANEGILLAMDNHLENSCACSDVEQLFEAIADYFILNPCIIWKTSGEVLSKENVKLKYFPYELCHEIPKTKKAQGELADETDYYVVLNGQNRITSLNIALYGSFLSFKDGRGNEKNNPKSWIERELYYNLDFYNDSMPNSKNPQKRFAFLSADEASLGNWYKVKSLLNYDNIGDYLIYLCHAGYNDKCIHDLCTLYRRIHWTDIIGTGLIRYYCIIEKDYSKVLDIFTRVNACCSM